jgi:predicted dehydrogenase
MKQLHEVPQLYCSDFYVDVRAIPLLAATGNLRRDDWQFGLIEAESTRLIQRIEIGELRRIEGRIAEDYPFHFGSWAGNKRSGGVIFEMMVHLFALLKRLFPNESMRIRDSKRLYADPDGTRGKFDAEPSGQDTGEGFAHVDGELTVSNASVSFEVLKQAYETDRYFKLIGSHGCITQ